jgi:HK97 family phage portal protein
MALSDFFNRLIGKENRLDRVLLKFLANNAIYPSDNANNYLASYTSNNDVFTVINKITEPGSVVPVYQYDKNGEVVENGKMLALLNKPNPYMTKAQFIEASITFYLLFGECFIAEQSIPNGLNANQPLRLDVLPSQWMEIILGTVFDPVAGYRFTMSEQNIDYQRSQVYHYREFNPDYDTTGGHLKGMSRLRPLLKSITGSQSGYDSLVKAFQNQGAWGILTMLGEDGKGLGELSKSQASMLKHRFKEDNKKGEIVVTGKDVKWTNFGLSVVDLNILAALGAFKGNICDAYNVPTMLLSGSQDRTYSNYKEAMGALWTNAIMPTVDGYLEGLTNFLAPKFKEEGQVLKADYSEIEVLQKNKSDMVTWMINARSFTKNEIREACGYEMLPDPAMDMIFDSAGMLPISELGMTEGEEVLKALKISDYRN